MREQCAMLGTVTLLLFVFGVSSAVTVEMEKCRPVVPPIDAIACLNQSSAFVTCACKTFREPVNKFLDEYSCLVLNISTRLNETFSRFEKDMKEFKMSSVAGLINSDLIKIIDEVVEIIREPAGKLIDKVYAEACGKQTEFVNCLAENVNKLMSDQVDMMIMKFINMEHIRKAATDLCGLREEFKNILSCNWKDLFLQDAGCVAVMMDSFEKIADEKSICAVIGDMSSCIGIQMYPCNAKLGQWLSTSVPDLLVETCKAEAKKGTKSIGGSRVVQCAISPIVSILGTNLWMMNYDMTTMPPTTTQRQQIERLTMMESSSLYTKLATKIKEGVKEFCQDAPMFMECVNRMIPESQNVLDHILKEILDMKHLAIDAGRKQIVNALCATETMDAVQKAIPCIADAVNSTDCESPAVFDNQVKEGGIKGDELREKLCKPLHNITECGIEKYVKKCDSRLYSLAMDLRGWLLRTECGGKRPSGQFKPVESEQKSNSPGSNNQRFISVLILSSLSLLVTYSSS